MYKFSSNVTENTPHLHYKHKPVNVYDRGSKSLKHWVLAQMWHASLPEKFLEYLFMVVKS